MPLSERVAIVTGATGDIGRSCVIELARDGLAVVAVGDHEQDLFALESTVRDSGGQASAVLCRTSDRDQVESMIALAIREYGRIDVIVNAPDAPTEERRLEDYSPAEFDTALLTGLHGPLNVMQIALPHLREADNASIINFGDPDSIVGEPGRATSNVTREAVRALSRTAAREWGRFGIRVNVVDPTVMTDQLRDRFSADADFEAWLLGQIPAKVLGEPEDVGRTVAFLASDDSAMLTGMNIPVDGGRSMYA